MKKYFSDHLARCKMKDKPESRRQQSSGLHGLRGRPGNLPPEVRPNEVSVDLQTLSAEKLEVIFNQFQDALIVINALDGKIIEANRAAENVLGYGRHHLVGRSFNGLSGWEPDTGKSGNKEQIRIVGSVFTRGYRLPDGTERFLDLTAAIIPWGDIKAILVTARDISERQAIETRLAQLLRQVEKSNEDLLAVLNLLSLGIVTIDRGGRVTFANRAALEMIGRSSQKALSWLRSFKQEADSIKKEKISETTGRGSWRPRPWPRESERKPPAYSA